jgi:hypothetical protein
VIGCHVLPLYHSKWFIVVLNLIMPIEGEPGR